MNPSAPSSIKIGILGFGTVGSSVARVLDENHDLIAEHAGASIKIAGVCDLRKLKTSYPLSSNPYALINDPKISIIVEAMGGENPAKKYILDAIKQGKHIVTTNKEVIAKHLPEILKAAALYNVSVLFEGAVGGGIPIIKPLQSDLAGNKITEIYGIVNGTTNYILSQMTEKGMEFSEALQRAKEKGIAEANPKMDIDGLDAAYKAVILASVAFSAKVNYKDIYCEGISKITKEDILYASEIGYVIKLLAIIKKLGDKLEIRVHPTLISRSHALATVSDAYNAIYIRGNAIGEVMFYGLGAGGMPTASAVVSDLIEIVASHESRVTSQKLKQFKIKPIGEIESRYYIRLTAPDQHGVLAGISKAFADEKVSIQAVVQKESKGNIATIVVIVHTAKERNIQKALRKIKKLAVAKKVCNVIRVGLE